MINNLHAYFSTGTAGTSANCGPDLKKRLAVKVSSFVVRIFRALADHFVRLFYAIARTVLTEKQLISLYAGESREGDADRFRELMTGAGWDNRLVPLGSSDSNNPSRIIPDILVPSVFDKDFHRTRVMEIGHSLCMIWKGESAHYVSKDGPLRFRSGDDYRSIHELMRVCVGEPGLRVLLNCLHQKAGPNHGWFLQRLQQVFGANIHLQPERRNMRFSEISLFRDQEKRIHFCWRMAYQLQYGNRPEHPFGIVCGSMRMSIPAEELQALGGYFVEKDQEFRAEVDERMPPLKKESVDWFRKLFEIEETLKGKVFDHEFIKKLTPGMRVVDSISRVVRVESNIEEACKTAYLGLQEPL